MRKTILIIFVGLLFQAVLENYLLNFSKIDSNHIVIKTVL